MYAQTADIAQIIDSLSDEYRIAAVNYIEYLAQVQKNKAKATLYQIQGMFAEEKGWASEEAMLNDMANFRRERLARCEY